MSSVNNCVIHLGSSRAVDEGTITDKVFVGGSSGDVEQSFERLLLNNYETPDEEDRCGGSVTFEHDVYAAAFNHIGEPEVVADWFMSLPWGDQDEAVLTISGNDSGLVCIRGEDKRADRIQWFT